MVEDTHVQDVLELTQLKHRYCHAIDDGDYETWVSLFADNGSFVRAGVDRYDGHDEIRTFANDVFDAAFSYSAHIVTNPVVEVSNETATGRWYLFLPYLSSEGERGWKQGVYEDTFRREHDKWRFETVTISMREDRTLGGTG
ncbi:SnoaL-like domain-containing protein [Halogeometricum rufum]|uniref:SnoaL-like domain-containing protein n=1 Tax=Halogeometricum rufum TaxID=553469 RepID=A0A1I6IFU4_9EURY|nr:nuclear transport factor 2 family protein [Halogeometricum rufum]SFR65566.1 SnoaL-like domain-containing protein [Halogeometricum rufum]